MINKIKTYSYKTIALILGIFASLDTFAHVKWFSGFDFVQKPKEIAEIVGKTAFDFLGMGKCEIPYLVYGLMLLSIVVAALIIFLDIKMEESTWNKKMNDWLLARQSWGTDILRFAMAAVLIICWINKTVFTPELTLQGSLIAWIEFIVAILLFIPATINIAGFALIGLYAYCIYQFGIFHMLDYLHFIGIGIYLITIKSNKESIKRFAIPVLYLTLGFALIWLAFEKLFYPEWSYQILDLHPVLSLGFGHEFFLKGSAFVEIGLGFLLLIGALSRPLAAVITLVFFLTSCVFGELEIIGHTSLHAMLLVFIINGTGGSFLFPLKKVSCLGKKLIYATISYIVIVLCLMFAYDFSAKQQYHKTLSEFENAIPLCHQNAERSSETTTATMLDITNYTNRPRIVEMTVSPEADNLGWNLHVELENWKFTPENIGKTFKHNQGHIHVYIDGKKFGRMYSNDIYLGQLSFGPHTIVVTINGDDHTTFTVQNKEGVPQMIGAKVRVNVLKTSQESKAASAIIPDHIKGSKKSIPLTILEEAQPIQKDNCCNQEKYECKK